MLGFEIREVVGDFELADAGRQAITQVTGPRRIVNNTPLDSVGRFVPVQHIEQFRNSVDTH